MDMPGLGSVSMNVETFKTTPPGIESPEISPTRSVSPSTLTSSSSNRGRRSVSSMKGLMPLALSPPLSNFGSRSSTQSLTVDDGEMEHLHDNMPELLARDLEMSSGVFASRDMTAGAPSIASIPDEKGRARAGKMLLYSPYIAASARVQVLGAIEERKSMVSFLGQHDPTLVEHHSDSASTTSHGSSEEEDEEEEEGRGEAAPPSFRHRGSVVTSATSVGSIRCKTRIPSLPERPCECSWMDADSDREEQGDDLFEGCNTGSLCPRPPTPPGPEPGIRVKAAVPRANMPITWAQSSQSLHRKSHSVNGDTGTPILQRYTLGSPLKVPQRSSSVGSLQPQPQPSMSYAESSLSQSSGTRPHCSSLKTESTKALAIDTASSNALFIPRARRVAVGPGRIRDLSPTSYGYLDSDDEAMYSPKKKRANKENDVFMRPPSPPQPLRSVQSWLNSSPQPCAWASYTEDNARVVPLPPDAVENLRVSVACFPETMLLTSSLTVETIRSYAKKVRQPSMDCSSIMNGEILLPESTRKSLWRKVVPYRRGSQPPDLRTSPTSYNSRYGHSSAPGSSAFPDTPKPWTPLKNVFGCCSDYICDALYAHIVAYNYVSALLARSSMSHSVRGRPSTTSTRDSQPQDDIPKKAASLLGLSIASDVSVGMARYPPRLGSSLHDWTKEGTMRQRDTGPTAQDNALRAIQSGLLRCISRLLATAKLVAENGTGEEGVVEMESEEPDMLFMRSLCEIVRMAEDAV
ncbi:hypothetical protein E4U54_001347 [Claviceps lovelessii]|nr:hypothetical protein E4U54_001347 [Claviceps lovelessii]